jgi:hypothetical protein
LFGHFVHLDAVRTVDGDEAVAGKGHEGAAGNGVADIGGDRGNGRA